MTIAVNQITIERCNTDLDVCNGCRKHFRVGEYKVVIRNPKDSPLVCFDCLREIYLELCDIIVATSLYETTKFVRTKKPPAVSKKEIIFRRYERLVDIDK